MRQISVEQADLNSCVSQAQRARLLITRKGRPVALLVGVRGLDAEQVELGSSRRFWNLITRRRRQPSMTRAELEQKLPHLR